MLIGRGNRMRGDDRAGPELARMVAELGPRATVIEHEGEATELIDLWEGAPLALVADAVAPAGSPGLIHRGEPGSLPIALSRQAGPRSTHALGLARTIELAASPRRLPDRLVVYGIEGARFNRGAPLSPAVDAALRSLAPEVFGTVEARPGPRPAAPHRRGFARLPGG